MRESARLSRGLLGVGWQMQELCGSRVEMCTRGVFSGNGIEMTSNSGSLSHDRRQRKRDLKDDEEEKACVFTPNINSRRLSVAAKEVKMMDQFVERQRAAREEKASKEPKDIANAWVRRITVPKEFTLTQQGTRNSRSTSATDLSVQYRTLRTTPAAKQCANFERAKWQLHKHLHTS
eukprot:TRINITY_DN11875_c0_g1_i1.p3 TRINITY_DN11875_c0_g1~~TRINITY_DN11875_c0_g1_i1.p3  ORF type:complete len:177 (+),score=18.69 TRINITY_DN11875_c0_g1_i1:806-1336(+)